MLTGSLQTLARLAGAGLLFLSAAAAQDAPPGEGRHGPFRWKEEKDASFGPGSAVWEVKRARPEISRRSLFAAGIRVGMQGTVLSGPSGEDPLQGGQFRVYQVLGENKSLARCSLQSLGKNTRVMITLSR